MKRFAIIGSAVLLLIAFASAWFTWRDYLAFLDRPLEVPEGGAVVDVRSGDTVRAVVSDIAARGMTETDWRWRLLLRLEPVTIQAGEYRVERGMRPQDLLRRLASGEVVQHRFTIVEGWNYRQLAFALQADPRLAVLPERLDSEAVMSEIGSDARHPEGWFLPETYAYVRGDDALDILRRAHAAMREALEQAWSGRDPELPLETPYELLTLASIVEKESAVPAERPRIAGVFVRRLEAGWRLETDPTVIYGLGETFDGDLRRRDLRTDTPYNTYTRRGLPPTPIALPGEGALQATARPQEGSAMFFVADGSGGHVFSDTLEDHNEAVRALIRRQRAGD